VEKNNILKMQIFQKKNLPSPPTPRGHLLNGGSFGKKTAKGFLRCYEVESKAGFLERAKTELMEGS